MSLSLFFTGANLAFQSENDSTSFKLSYKFQGCNQIQPVSTRICNRVMKMPEFCGAHEQDIVPRIHTCSVPKYKIRATITFLDLTTRNALERG